MDRQSKQHTESNPYGNQVELFSENLTTCFCHEILVSEPEAAAK